MYISILFFTLLYIHVEYCRNPVTNIPSMVGVTDIPDWCHIEAKGLDSYNFDAFFQGGPDIDTLKRMQEVCISVCTLVFIQTHVYALIVRIYTCMYT